MAVKPSMAAQNTLWRTGDVVFPPEVKLSTT